MDIRHYSLFIFISFFDQFLHFLTILKMEFENGVENENGISIETILENKHKCKIYKLILQKIERWIN